MANNAAAIELALPGYRFPSAGHSLLVISTKIGTTKRRRPRMFATLFSLYAALDGEGAHCADQLPARIAPTIELQCPMAQLG